MCSISSSCASVSSQALSSPAVGGFDGCSSTKAKRRRIAASISPSERSVVFIVPMKKTLGGMMNSASGEYSKPTGNSRYSSRKYSSPNTLARFARLISSTIRM